MDNCEAPPPLMSSSSSEKADPEALSDDSGVELKRCCPSECGRRNKRKSSEPKRRHDVLLLGRFQWDTDDEEAPQEEGERPGSGDSGCPPAPLESAKKRPSSWKRSDAPRQSVIRKNEPTSTFVPPVSPATAAAPADAQRRPRNYKSMSRQRRIEANARERTRVHTISAAFDDLRRAVPAYAHNQKLSKLAVLRIASAYIVALACLSEQGPAAPALEDCVDRCTRTIQAEGKSRRRASKD